MFLYIGKFQKNQVNRLSGTYNRKNMTFFSSAWKLLLLIVVLSGFNIGCYRMPTEDDYCVIPMTNNRDLQRKESQIMPSVGY